MMRCLLVVVVMFASMSSIVRSDNKLEAMLKEGEGVIDDLVEMYVRVGLEAENWFESGRLAFEKASVLRPRDFELWIQMAEMRRPRRARNPSIPLGHVNNAASLNKASEGTKSAATRPSIIARRGIVLADSR